jgi:4-fold beta flower protein
MKPRYIWNTDGDWVATLIDEYIWDLAGAWVGWMVGEDVFTTDGEWVGTLSRDSRILRKRTATRPPLRTDIPTKPAKPDLPGRAPLPPTFSGLDYSTVDVLEEDPAVFKRLSDMRRDMGE